jgi:hypothetical protein
MHKILSLHYIVAEIAEIVKYLTKFNFFIV